MRSAVALRSFMILHLFSMTEAMCLKSSRDEKTSPDTKKFIESTKTSKDFQTDLLENYINTIINQWKKGRTGRLVDDQSGTWKISLNHEKLGSGELLAKMTQEGLRRMARRNTAGDERLVDKASNILMFIHVYCIHNFNQDYDIY